MDTGNPADDKILVDKRVYNLAFAVHRDALGSRWHYVSLPVTLGLGRDAEMLAARFDGDAPKWDQAWFNVVLFYPGQVSWPHLNSAKHAGADKIKEGVPVKSRHSEIQLAHYGVEGEFAEAIKWQWLLTLVGRRAADHRLRHRPQRFARSQGSLTWPPITLFWFTFRSPS